MRWWNGGKKRPFNVSHQHPNSNYYTLNFLMNRIERQARWNGALVHWFHGPPVALLSYPPHWFHRIGHAGCKTLFYSRRVMGSRWTVLFLRQRSTQETLLCEASSSKRIISIVEKKKKINFLFESLFLDCYIIIAFLVSENEFTKFRKSISKRGFRILHEWWRNNDQRYPIFGDPL